MDETPINTSSADHSLQNLSARKCSLTKCYGTFSDNTLLCSSCNRHVHYKCSQLPLYQIQSFLVNKRNMKHFNCYNCVVVPKELSEICTAETSEALKIEILEKDVSDRNRIIKLLEEKESKLTQTIDILRSRIIKMKEKSIDMCTVEFLNERIQENLNELGSVIKTSIMNEIEHSLKKVENEVREVKQSYADATKGLAPKGAPCTDNLKEIVKEARYAELSESRDQHHRVKNIIIHRVAENDLEQSSDADKDFVMKLVEDIKIPPPTIKSVTRIGQQDDSKKRPIKVVLSSEKEKSSILRNLSGLKNKESYNGISVTEDLTIAERSIFKQWSERAKDQNRKEPDDSNFVWRVRGDSKKRISPQEASQTEATINKLTKKDKKPNKNRKTQKNKNNKNNTKIK